LAGSRSRSGANANWWTRRSASLKGNRSARKKQDNNRADAYTRKHADRAGAVRVRTVSTHRLYHLEAEIIGKHPAGPAFRLIQLGRYLDGSGPR
jgi:hypothetical protein